MNKTVFLYVSGSDFSALDFERNYNPQDFYEEMVKKGLKLDIVNTDEIYAEVRIKEFGLVDSEFVSFVLSELVDYDFAKAENIYEVQYYIPLEKGEK